MFGWKSYTVSGVYKLCFVKTVINLTTKTILVQQHCNYKQNGDVQLHTRTASIKPQKNMAAGVLF